MVDGNLLQVNQLEKLVTSELFFKLVVMVVVSRLFDTFLFTLLCILSFLQNILFAFPQFSFLNVN